MTNRDIYRHPDQEVETPFGKIVRPVDSVAEIFVAEASAASSTRLKTTYD